MDDPGQEGGFRQAHFADVFVEIGQRSLAKTVNREAAAIPEINFIGVKFENLLLGEPALEFQRHHGFGNLAAQGAVRVEEKAARHLHRNRTAALDARPVAQISPCGAKNSNRIEAGMFEEAPVFDRKHGIAQHLWDVVEAHGPAFLAGVVEQAGQ